MPGGDTIANPLDVIDDELALLWVEADVGGVEGGNYCVEFGEMIGAGSTGDNEDVIEEHVSLSSMSRACWNSAGISARP